MDFLRRSVPWGTARLSALRYAPAPGAERADFCFTVTRYVPVSFTVIRRCAVKRGAPRKPANMRVSVLGRRNDRITGLFAAIAHSRLWRKAAVQDVRSHVGSWG